MARRTRNIDEKPVLECQQCGDVLRELSDAEAQKVARNPYAFVVYCRNCQQMLRGAHDGF